MGALNHCWDNFCNFENEGVGLTPGDANGTCNFMPINNICGLGVGILTIKNFKTFCTVATHSQISGQNHLKIMSSGFRDYHGHMFVWKHYQCAIASEEY